MALAQAATWVSLAERIAGATLANWAWTCCVGISACGNAARMSCSCRRVDSVSGLRLVSTSARLSSSRISGAPVQADETLVVEVDQQAAGGRAEQGVGIGNDRDHGCQPASISLSRSAPNWPRALRWRVCS